MTMEVPSEREYLPPVGVALREALPRDVAAGLAARAAGFVCREIPALAPDVDPNLARDRCRGGL